MEDSKLLGTDFFVVDMTKTETEGAIECPQCGIEISPDDNTEDTFTILEPVMKGETLEKIVLQCNKCGSRIHLTGFSQLGRKK